MEVAEDPLEPALLRRELLAQVLKPARRSFPERPNSRCRSTVLKAFHGFLSLLIPCVRRTITPDASRSPKRNSFGKSIVQRSAHVASAMPGVNHSGVSAFFLLRHAAKTLHIAPAWTLPCFPCPPSGSWLEMKLCDYYREKTTSVPPRFV